MSLEKNYVNEGLGEGIPLPSKQENLSSQIQKMEASLQALGGKKTGIDAALSKLDEHVQGALQDTKDTSRTRIDGLLNTAREAFSGKLEGIDQDSQNNQLDNLQMVKTRIAPLSGIVSSPEEMERNAHMKESLTAFFNNPANRAEIHAIENPDQIA